MLSSAEERSDELRERAFTGPRRRPSQVHEGPAVNSVAVAVSLRRYLVLIFLCVAASNQSLLATLLSALNDETR